MSKGSCHCGAVKLEVDAFAGQIAHCHCRTCRKTHSAAFASTIRVDRENFVGPQVSRSYDTTNRAQASPATSAATVVPT